jgi:hypothetical protein
MGLERTVPANPAHLERMVERIALRMRAGMGRAGIEPATLGLRVPCSTS